MPDTLHSDPADVAARHLAAGRIAESKAIYEEVLRAEPSHVRALCGLAAVALKGGETARALELVAHAVAIAPKDGETVGNLGVVYLARNELTQAEDCLRRALDLAPHRAELHANMASLYLTRGDTDMALVAQQRAVELAPEDASQAFNLANALAVTGRTTDAVDAYEAVLRLAPSHTGALNNLSVLHKQAGNLDAAEALLAEARLQDPLNPELLANHADLLLRRGRRDEALETMKRATGLAPGHPRLRAALGTMLLELGRLPEAAAELSAAMRGAPSDAGIALTLARLLRRQGRLDAAQTAIDRATDLAGADSAGIQPLGAELLLMRGRYEEAWDRLAGAQAVAPPQLPEPNLSDGADLKGQRIRLVALDAAASLFAARFLAALSARGAESVVLCPPLLASLLETVPGVAEAVPTPDLDLAAFAAEDVPTMLLDNLPHRLRATPERWPATFPVFAVPPAARGDERRIGVWWEGSGPGAALPASLRDVEGVELVSLQTGPARESGRLLLDRPGVVDRGDAIADFRDLAAEIAALDVVIAPDGPVAHLAAGLGVETWVMVDRDGSWYWPVGSTPSPWYPHSRAFAQAADGSWTAAMEALRAALAAAPVTSEKTELVS